MNYLNNTPRQLIYRERPSLEDFGVYKPDTLNAKLYKSLIRLNRLKPREKGALEEVLRLMNDAYYYLTVIFLEKNPLERYAEICEDADKVRYEFQWERGQRALVVKCLLITMLGTFGKKLPPPQKHQQIAIRDDINEEQAYVDPARMARLAMGMEEDPVYKLTSEFEFNAMVGSIKPQDYAPRDIQEVINSGESLKGCLAYEEHLREAVDALCNNDKQKLALIERLLEPEKEDYGILDSRITHAYRSLYELRAELTGEQLPEQLPFENRTLLSPPMLPLSTISYDDSEETADTDEDSKTDHYQQRIRELEEEVEKLKEEIKTQENLHAAQKWIGCFDFVFDQKLNVEAIANELCDITSPHLPKQQRSFWWAVFAVFSELKWIPAPSKSKSFFLKWVNLHFGCGWDWRKDNQFKFADINEKIRTTPSTSWSKETTGNVTGEYYSQLASKVRCAFVEDVDGRIIDRSKFILPGCQRINSGRK